MAIAPAPQHGKQPSLVGRKQGEGENPQILTSDQARRLILNPKTLFRCVSGREGPVEVDGLESRQHGADSVNPTSLAVQSLNRLTATFIKVHI